MNTCIIILGGEFSLPPNTINSDYIIACDSGYTNALKLGLVPDLLIGDFDSYKGNINDIPQSIEILKFNPIKDDTDCMLAVRHAISKGYKHIVFLCALGGRMDHILGNIQSMSFVATHDIKVELFSKNEYMTILTSGMLKIPYKEGYSLSLFSLSDTCNGVSINGSKYDVDNFTLTSTFPIGYGNAYNEKTVTISLNRGILLIVQSLICE